MVTASSATAEPSALSRFTATLAGWTMFDRLAVRLAPCKAELGHARERGPEGQFRLLSTSALALIHGIMARSFSPICSIGCWASLARIEKLRAMMPWIKAKALV